MARDEGPSAAAPGAVATLGEAAAIYAATLPQEQRGEVQAEVLRFARWYGGERTLQDMRSHDLGLYSQTYGPSTPGAQHRLEALRAFFAFAKRKGWTATNLAAQLRLPKVGRNNQSPRAVPSQEARLTSEGYAALRRELEELVAQRPQVAVELQRAMADKDFRENSPLEAMREHQAHLEARIRALEAILKRAVVMKAPLTAEARTRVGSTVLLCNLATGARVRYTLVDPREVNTAQGRISVLSPVGKALLNHSMGEEVAVAAPAGNVRFRIEAIES